MNAIEKTDEFREWLLALKDKSARAGIGKRIRRAEGGNFGDHKSVGGGVSEMRIDVGAGYRVYYGQTGKTIYLLLIGGDKSTQSRDIAEAKAMWNDIKRSAK